METFNNNEEQYSLVDQKFELSQNDLSTFRNCAGFTKYMLD